MQTVKILNPAHGDGWTSIKRATEHVERGRAVWRNKPDGRLAIKFIVAASTPNPQWDGIDRRGMRATLEEQRHVPLMTVKFPVHQHPQLDARGHRRKA